MARRSQKHRTHRTAHQRTHSPPTSQCGSEHFHLVELGCQGAPGTASCGRAPARTCFFTQTDSTARFCYLMKAKAVKLLLRTYCIQTHYNKANSLHLSSLLLCPPCKPWAMTTFPIYKPERAEHGRKLLILFYFGVCDTFRTSCCPLILFHSTFGQFLHNGGIHQGRKKKR